MERLLQQLGEPMPPKMKDRFGVASNTASADLALNEGQVQLSKWRSRLTEEQIESIFRVVGEFGLDFYSMDLRPNLERLKDVAGRSTSTKVA
jgi:Tat protein secretion system quality control protein TatD with DNase activity